MTLPNVRPSLLRLSAAAALLAAPLGAQTPSHVYTLDNGGLGDALGGPSLVQFGTNTAGTFGGEQGFFFNAGGGFTLSSALASPSVYSIELRFLFDQTTSWRKILDFKNRTTDYGFYNLGGTANFYSSLGGNPNVVFTPGELASVVVTRSATNVFSAYVDGALQFSFNDAGNNATFSGPSNIIHFLHDDGAENASGFVDYIRLYDQALTAQQVAALAPPGSTVTPEPATVALLATGLLAVGGVARRRRRA